MDHIEQATRLRQAIHEAKVDLIFAGQCLHEDELKFRHDALVGVLTIAYQDMNALIENWKTAGEQAQAVVAAEREPSPPPPGSFVEYRPSLASREKADAEKLRAWGGK